MMHFGESRLHLMGNPTSLWGLWRENARKGSSFSVFRKFRREFLWNTEIMPDSFDLMATATLLQIRRHYPPV